jgi:DNA (cytosine-5)-methyltransferase 1
MKVLSLFGGIECGRVALDQLGVQVEKYYSSEIDPYAIKVSSKNYPDIIHMGDATKWQDWDIDWSEIDLLLAGFPCQAWSIAGAQGGVTDERGKLLYTMMDILDYLRVLNPNIKFLFENVKMKKEFLDFVNKIIGVEPVEINSRLLTAQNRPRIYWTNLEVYTIKAEEILLKDILEDNVDPKYTLSEKAVDYMSRLRNGKPRWEYHKNPLNGKAACLTANMYKGVPYGVVQELNRRLTPLECERLQGLPDNYTEGISSTQRYKCIGNGWSVPVIKHILKK